MRTIYFHIGMHKTGTTALQNFLFINKSFLIKNGIHYFSDSPVDYRITTCLRKKKDLDFVRNQIKAIKKLKEKNVILSSESYIQKDHVPELLHSLLVSEGINDEFNVKIIIYIRRQDLWLESAYLQISKDLNWKAISFERYLKISGLDNYLKRIFIWGDIFQYDNIILKPYEKSQFKNNNLFADFLDTFNIDLSENYKYPEEKGLNISIDAVTASIINNSKQLFKSQKELNKFVNEIKRIKSDEYNRVLLDKEDRLKIISKYESLNESLAEKFLDRKDKKLFYEPPKFDNLVKMSEWEINEKSIDLLVKLYLNRIKQ